MKNKFCSTKQLFHIIFVQIILVLLSRELAAAQFQRYFHVIRENIVEVLHSSIKGVPVRSVSYSIFKPPIRAHRSNEVHNNTTPALHYATY